MAFLLFLYLHGRVHWNVPPATGLATHRVLWLAAAVLVFQAKVTWEWERHRSLLRSELSRARGIVDSPTGAR